MDMPTPNPENREALLETLALRLSVHIFDPRADHPQLFVGRLPEGLPFELPIPEGSRIIGSLARSSKHLEMVLDVPLPPEQALAFYRERLLAAGWNEPEQPMHGPHQGGFVHSGIFARRQSVLFCKGPHGPALDINAPVEHDGFTDVRLDLNLDERMTPCGQSARARRQQRRHMDTEPIIPILDAPAGARQMPDGGGGGAERWYSAATLEADEDLATLAAHYASQLEKAGWTQTAAGSDGPLAWHTWTLKDEDGEPWRGFFFILKTLDLEREYSLYAKAEWVNKDQPKSGWFSYARLS